MSRESAAGHSHDPPRATPAWAGQPAARPLSLRLCPCPAAMPLIRCRRRGCFVFRESPATRRFHRIGREGREKRHRKRDPSRKGPSAKHRWERLRGRLFQSVDDRPPADQADLAFVAGAAVENGNSHSSGQCPVASGQCCHSRVTGHQPLLSRPNLDFALQVNLVFLVDFFANDLHELEDVISRASGDER